MVQVSLFARQEYEGRHRECVRGHRAVVRRIGRLIFHTTMRKTDSSWGPAV